MPAYTTTPTIANTAETVDVIPAPYGTRDVTIDHQDRREGVDGRDGAEHDERRAGHPPEPLPIRAQRGAEHLPNRRRPCTSAETMPRPSPETSIWHEHVPTKNVGVNGR